MIYYINAYTTLISAALGVCFSIGAIIKEKGNNRTNALYMFARSLALTCAAVIPICSNYHFICCYSGNANSTDS